MKSFIVDSQVDLEDPVAESDVILVDSSQSREMVLNNMLETVKEILES